MAIFKIIKKGTNNFWHTFNNNSKTVNLSEFEVVLDSISQTFSIAMRNGANVPNNVVEIVDIIVIDETDASIEETFANVEALRVRLIELGYTPYMVYDGLIVSLISTDADNSIVLGTDGKLWSGVGGSTPDATTTTKGKLKLAGDLAGTADLPTVPNKLDKNTAITGATKTKITYDSKGLVTNGADATTADIADSTNKRYVTDANLTVIGNTSGINTGDNATNSQYSGLETSKENISNKGIANGYVPLNSSTEIDLAYFPDAILGQLLYGGVVNISTAVATLTNNAKTKLGTALSTITLTNNTTAITGYTANEGIYYIATVAGTFATISFEVGDWLVSIGSAWVKIDNTDAISSFNGRTGAITLISGDISSALGATPVTGAGLSNQIAYFTSNGSAIAGLDTTTYPSLTELAYVKGVTSSIQTQLDAKISAVSPTLTGLTTLTGTSQTGSSANGILSLTQTWNTTGSPTAIILNVTNTASGSVSRLLDLQTGGVSRFAVDKLGGMSATLITSTAEVNAGLANAFTWGTTNSRATIYSPSNGVIRLSNGTGTDFTRLQFGLTNNTAPSIKRNGTALNFRLADDSADCPITASNGTFSGNLIASGTTSVLRLKGYTVATLPSGTQGDNAFVTDALAPTILNTVVGGGTVVVRVFYNGTNWIVQ